MPAKPNQALRLIVPLALIAVSVLVAWAVFTNTQNQRAGGPGAATPPAQAPAQPATTPPDPPEQTPAATSDDVADGAAQNAVTESAPDHDEQPVATAGPADTGYAALDFGDDPLANSFATIGSLDPTHDPMQVTFSPVGAGVERIALGEYYQSIKREAHVVVQEPLRLLLDASRNLESAMVPMAALWVSVDGENVPLADTRRRLWRQVAPDRPGEFEAFIIDADGNNVLRLTRSYIIAGTGFDLSVHQAFENLSDRPLTVRWHQLGPTDLDKDRASYGGDKRRVRFGYLLDAQADPTREFVHGQKFLMARSTALGSQQSFTAANGATYKAYAGERTLWPNPTASEEGLELCWAAMTNRYFATAVHALVDPATPRPDKRLGSIEQVDRIASGNAETSIMALRLTSVPMTIAPGKAARLDLGLYTGPLNRPIIGRSPSAVAAGVESIVVYNFGGMCAFCTFSWLTGPLLALLRLLHSILFDWSLAIIALVVCVRTILHPVTKWSQIRIQRFSKQMQDMAPKMKKLQERYKDDKQKLQQESAKLWREEGINPAGMLGCLPMFLQSPVWIALYATLYFVFDLRQHPAFFGVFQAFTPAWPFLADLSEPDSLIPFGAGFDLPLMGHISSFNALPIVLAFVFYVHQKYMSPPTTVTMTPEQESQQKMMKIMMVVMFPVMMYNAPSGLALYFIANSTLGILESRYIRAHITKKDLLTKPQRKKGGSGFMSRIMDMAEQQRQMREQGAPNQRAKRLGQGPNNKGPQPRRKRGR